MNQEKQLSNIKILIIIGFTFIAFSLTLSIVTYVIPYWVSYSNSAPSGSDWTNYQRIKGIFQECLQNPIFTNVAISQQYIIKNNCTDNDIGQYGISGDPIYSMIIRIRQSQIGLHGAALLLLLIILIMGIGIFMKWCCTYSDSSFYIKWRNALGALSFLSFLCLAASSSLGTSLILIETNNTYITTFLPLNPSSNASITFLYGYMFYLSWTATLIALLSAILFFISAHIGKSLELEKYKPHVVAIDNPTFIGDQSKTTDAIFLQPTGSSFDFTPTPNEITSPGLLPRYDISTLG